MNMVPFDGLASHQGCIPSSCSEVRHWIHSDPEQDNKSMIVKLIHHKKECLLKRGYNVNVTCVNGLLWGKNLSLTCRDVGSVSASACLLSSATVTWHCLHKSVALVMSSRSVSVMLTERAPSGWGLLPYRLCRGLGSEEEQEEDSALEMPSTLKRKHEK